MASDSRAKLTAEFLTVVNYPLKPFDTFDAVVVLCAEEVKVAGENKDRIVAGLDLVKKNRPNGPLIFLGTVGHNQHLQDYLTAQKDDTVVYYPTNRTQDSSRSQLQHLAVFLRDKTLSNLLIISHAYHIPRVRRYAHLYLKDQSFDFYPVGRVEDQTKQVAGEIEKIIDYAAKGDLSLSI